MAELLAAEPDIDAVFAASDLTAIGAMRAIEAAGRRVRDDIAVVGFDDIGDAELAHPALTTVRQPIAEMGRTMATRLLQRIAGESAAAADRAAGRADPAGRPPDRLDGRPGQSDSPAATNFRFGWQQIRVGQSAPNA